MEIKLLSNPESFKYKFKFFHCYNMHNWIGYLRILPDNILLAQICDYG